MCFESLVSLLIDKLDKLSERVQAQGTTLDKLEERLQVQLGHIWEVRYRVDSLDRRLGELDNKFDRHDTAVGRRFDKLTEAVAAHDHKDGSAKEQLVRKVDNAYERIVYMENNSISKMQATVAAVLDKTTSFAAESKRAVDQVVGRARDELATALDAVHAKLNATHDYVQNASRAVASQDDAEESESGRKACLDASETATKNLRQHMDAKVDLMSTKVSGLYNDMWARVNALESMTKSVISLSNATRRDVQSLGVEVRGVQHSQHGRYHGRQPTPEPGNIEYALNMHDDAVDRHLKALRDTLLDELRNVQQVQDTFLRTCSRLNDKDISTEEKLSRILHHHTNLLIQHGVDLNDIIKTQKASLNATDGAKRLEAVARSLAEQGRLEARQVAEALVRLENVTAAVQNATERAAVCGVRPDPTDEDAAWSALLQHNETGGTTEPTVPASPETPEHPPERELGRDRDLDQETSVSGQINSTLSTSSTTPAARDTQWKRPLDSISGDELLSGHGHSQSQHVSQDIEETGQDAVGVRGSVRDSRRGQPAPGRPESTTNQETAASSGSGQDSVTDLSSVDDEDYTEENDDETDFFD